MPPAVVAVATAISAAAANTAAALGATSAVIEAVSSITYSAAAIGITSGALYGIGVATAPKLPDPVAMQTPLKQPMPVRTSATGTVRMAGAYMLFATSSLNPNLSIDVQAMLAGRSQAFVAHYLNDDLMAKTSSGNYWWAPGAPGKYGGGGTREPNLVRIDTRLGVTPETAYPISVDIPAWDANHRGDAITSTLLRCTAAKREDQSGDFPNGLPSLSSVIQAQLLYDPRDGGQVQGDPSTYKWSDNPVLGLLGFLTDAEGGMNLPFDRFIAPTTDYWKGAADECDGVVSTSGMHATLLDAATEGDNKIFLADTTGLTVGMTVRLATENAVVSGFGLAGEVDLSDDLTYPHAAGELAYWDATGQQARYRCNLAYPHDQPSGDVIRAYLSTFDGFIGQRGDGALVPRTNTIYAAGFKFTNRHIIGYQLQKYLPDEQATNQRIVSFTDPASAYNKAEAGYVQNDIDIAQRGRTRSQELYLQSVPSSPQAIAIGRTIVTRDTQPNRGTLTCNLAGLAVLGHRYVPVQIVEDGDTLLDGIVEVTSKPVVDLQAKRVTFSFVDTGYRSNGASQALCFILDLTKPSDLSPADLTTKLIAGVANALTLISATIGSGPDIAIVVYAHSVSSIVKRSASAADIADLIAWVQALAQDPANYLFNAEACLTAAKTFFDATDAGITSRRIVFVWQGASDHGFTGSNPGIYLTNILAAQVIAQSMPEVLINMINTEAADTTFAAYLDNTPDDGIPYAPDPAKIAAAVEQAVFGSSSTPGAGYVLPPLAPPSGAALQPLPAPAITSVTPDYADAGGGGVSGARLAIVVADPGGNVSWNVRWKLAADSLWTSGGTSLEADGGTDLLTDFVVASGVLDVQVAYITASQTSDWSATETVTMAAAPGGVASTSKSANFTTTPDHNVYYVDTSAAAVTASLNAAPSLNEVAEIWDATGHAGTHPISLDGNGKTIAGAANVANAVQINFGKIKLIYEGTQWLAS